MGQSWSHELGVGQVAKPGRLHTSPPEPLTRGGRFDRDERVILKGSEQTPGFRRFPLHVWSLFARSIGALSNDRTYATAQQPVGPRATVAAGRGIIRSAVEKRRSRIGSSPL